MPVHVRHSNCKVENHNNVVDETQRSKDDLGDEVDGRHEVEEGEHGVEEDGEADAAKGEELPCHVAEECREVVDVLSHLDASKE